MAGRKRNFAEDIVRKLCRADELTAAGKTQKEIAANSRLSMSKRSACRMVGAAPPTPEYLSLRHQQTPMPL